MLSREDVDVDDDGDDDDDSDGSGDGRISGQTFAVTETGSIFSFQL